MEGVCGHLCFSKVSPPQLVGFQASIFLLARPCDQAGCQEHPRLWGWVGVGGCWLVGFCEPCRASQSMQGVWCSPGLNSSLELPSRACTA